MLQDSAHCPTGTIDLDAFIRRLQVLQAQGAGPLPVLIETRSRTGIVIYARANARLDRVASVDGKLRRAATAGLPLVDVVRVG